MLGISLQYRTWRDGGRTEECQRFAESSAVRAKFLKRHSLKIQDEKSWWKTPKMNFWTPYICAYLRIHAHIGIHTDTHTHYKSTPPQDVMTTQRIL